MIPKELDETDIKIINALKKNGRISMTDLGRQVYLTSQAVKNRLERLQDLGIVERYTVNVNCPVFGYAVHGIFELTLSEDKRSDFLAFVKTTEYHILHCYVWMMERRFSSTHISTARPLAMRCSPCFVPTAAASSIP